MAEKEMSSVPPAKVLQAESFQLVDEQGEIIAVLASSPDKRPNLLVFDPAGKPLISLGMNASGEPAFSLTSGKSNASVSLSLNEGQPALLLANKEGKARASVTLIMDGEPVVALYDQDGKTLRAVLGPISADTSPTDETDTSLVFFGPDGQVMWKAP